MARRVGVVNDVTLTGGCSKNEGLAHALEKKLDIEVKKLSQDPQLVGALGAAIFAAERLEARS